MRIVSFAERVGKHALGRKKAFSLLASLPGVFGRKEADLWNLGIFADFLTRKCTGYPDGKKEISVTYGLAFFV